MNEIKGLLLGIGLAALAVVLTVLFEIIDGGNDE